MPRPNWTYQEIEDAVLTALEDLKAENGGDALEVKAYQGQFSSAEAITLVLNRFPMVLVSVFGSNYTDPESSARGTQNQTFRIMVWVGSRSWRKTAASAGAYDLLHAVRSRLAGSVLGLTGVFPCYPRSEAVVTAEPTVTVFQAEYWLINPRMTWGI